MAYTTIKKPSDYFNTITYTGDGSASRNITGVGFQPDWVWGKCRNVAVSHAVYDSVRGASNLLNTNSNSAEGTNPALNAFISDGFTVNSDSYFNGNTNTYVAWNWLADNTSGSSNTNGNITSTVSANTTSGFSIGKWLGNSSASATVGHGLGTTPAVIITKELNGTDYWHVWHKDLTNPNNLFLNTNSAQQAPGDGTISNVGSSTFGFQGATNVVAVNESGINNVFYCFAEVKGFSKFGSYTGNGSTDGTFVYTGFKPAFVMIKSSSQVETSWVIVDNKREGYNPDNNRLFPESNLAESTSDVVDLLSNGFKLRSGAGSSNGSGYTHTYMAFAEEPLVGDNPATAR